MGGSFSVPGTPKASNVIVNKDNSGQVISFDEFRRFATENNFPIEPSHEKYYAFLRANSSPHFKVRTRQEAAMFFAHVLQETGGYQSLVEQNPPAGAYGHFHAYPDQEYYGRGYLQISWPYNYGAASASLHRRHPEVVESSEVLLANPSRVEQDEALAWRTALWFWSDRVRNQCNLSRFGETTKIINPIECQNPEEYSRNVQEQEEVKALNDKAKKRFRYYAKNLEVLGIEEKPVEGGCYN